ncbi:hypothetical protein D4R42_04705 [bacterium]|nr:MAG: hypothetical protein D4R42_04705 [bacterium]
MVLYTDKDKKHIGHYREGFVTLQCWECQARYSYELGSLAPDGGKPWSGETIQEFMFKPCPKCGHGIALFVAYQGKRAAHATTLTAFFGGPGDY